MKKKKKKVGGENTECNQRGAWLAELLEPVTLGFKVASLSPMLGMELTLKNQLDLIKLKNIKKKRETASQRKKQLGTEEERRLG